MNRFLFILTLCGLCHGFAGAQTQLIANPAGANTENWGTARTERYDVAFPLQDESLTGSLIKEVRIPFMAAEDTYEHTIWLSEKLSLENRVNAPDIVQMEADTTGGYLSVVFDSPVRVPETGLFIGYSFNLEMLFPSNRQPLTVARADKPGQFYIHTSKKYMKWDTYNLPLVPAMQIVLEGDFHHNDVAVTDVSEVGTLRGETPQTEITLRNHGFDPVSSTTLTLTLNGVATEHNLTFNPPLPAEYFSDVTVSVPLEGELEPGDYSWNVKINDVNGNPNASSFADATSELYVYPSMPERVPLMEEYTGTWCGWCPRGIVGMERMNELYPGEFVCAVYHRDNDIMNTVPEVATPYLGAPSGYLDRTVSVDPFNGLSQYNLPSADMGIGKAWNQRREAPTTGSISVDASWEDAEMTILKVRSTSEFVRRYRNTPFRVAYLLIADGLKGESTEDAQWWQSNYYPGQKGYENTELAFLTELPRYINDMVYNDVVVSTSVLTGEPESIPQEVEMLVPVSHEYKFNVSSIRNIFGNELPIHKDKLRVVAALVNTLTGEVANCAQVAVAAATSVAEIKDAHLYVEKTGGMLLISGIEAGETVSLFSADGKAIYHGPAADGKIPAPVSGIYILSAGSRSLKLSL